MDPISEYLKYIKDVGEVVGDRKEIYKKIKDTYNIQSALYPGSHIDITPSLVIPEVMYVDNFKGAIKFFKHLDIIETYIKKNKSYNDPSRVYFKGEDYSKVLLKTKYDLIISQFAGFVGQATKKYLKSGGYLFCNDSHGDATLAYHDQDYELIGIINKDNEISVTSLEKYFKLKNNKKVNIKTVVQQMKGPKYNYQSDNYIFRLK